MSVIVPQAYQYLPQKQVNQTIDMGGWSFLQQLSETKVNFLQNREDDTKQTTYVHPIEKRSVTKLSLEMCTESLGTENGSESGEEISLLAFKATDYSVSPDLITTKPHKEINLMSTRQSSFPPPLNSSTEFSRSRIVRSYKEDGRLVVQAIRVCSPPRCFVSERREGRLRLCLSESFSLSDDDDDDDDDEELKENEIEFETRHEDEDEEENDGEEDDDDAEEEEEEAEEEEGIVGNNENFEGIIGNEKFSRRPKRRCEATTMLNWKPQQVWVTT